MTNISKRASRYNSGKPRFSLIPPNALNELAKVYTIGAEKYTVRNESGEVIEDGSLNWTKGMSWRSVLDSIERHINKFKKGLDFDQDYPKELLDKYGPTYHLANAAWGLFTLMEYYKIYPQGDDRQSWFKKSIKSVYLDIDGVIGAFEEHFLKRFGYEGIHANDWNDPIFRNKYQEISKDENFWLTLPKLEEPDAITYPISGYCTSRSISKEITQKWLDFNRFPTGNLIRLELGESKVEALKKAGCDVFIDDSIKNFVELQSNGILCYLKTRPHNIKYDVGFYRVGSLSEFFEKVRALS